MAYRSVAVLVLACFLGFSATAHATSPQAGAHQKLESTVNNILAIVMDPAYPSSEQRPVLNQKIEKEVREIFDFYEFSMRTVGPTWRSFSPDQQQRFSSAFAELLIYTYLGKIDKYNGEKIVYTGDKSDPSGQRIEIQTLLAMKDGKAIPVAYRMLPKNSSWFVYDVLVEGISLVKNYRTQFHDILSKNSSDELITRVQQKAHELREMSNAPK